MIVRHIPAWLKFSLAAIMAAFLLAVGSYQLGKYSERQRGAVLQLQADIQTERARMKDDAQTRNLSDYDLCMFALSHRGLHSR
ncbi:hypothetical protein ACLBWZ_03410 [Brucellaceae bacterium C25G]